jgi:transketolase
VETAVAWQDALEQKKAPSVLALTRQGLPPQARDAQQLADVRRGAYVLRREQGDEAQAIIIATGSEVGLAMETAEQLAADHIDVRVVSMPNAEIFAQQDPAYRQQVLPPAVRARVAVEAGISQYWRAWVGDGGAVLGIDSFGASAPASVLMKEYGFTPDNLNQMVRGVIDQQERSA